MAGVSSRRPSRSEEAQIFANSENIAPEVRGEPGYSQVNDDAVLDYDSMGDTLRKQAFFNIGYAATVHQAIQTEDGGMSRIIYVGKSRNLTKF